MGTVFKAYQVQVDASKPTKISSYQLKNLGDSDFTDDTEKTSKENLLNKLQAFFPAGPSKSHEPEGSNSDESSTPSEIVSQDSSMVESIVAGAKRRVAELEEWEQRLKNWEQALLDREKRVDSDEEKLHQEIMNKRQNVENETKKLLDMARTSADNLLKTAKTDTESSKKAVQIELENIQKKAHSEGYSLGQEKGFAKGEQEGLHEGRLEWQTLMKETEMLIQELQTSRMGILKSVEEEMLKLVLGFAKRVIKIEPVSQPNIILENLHEAIGKVAEVDKIVLRINLKDKSMVEAHKEEFLNRLSGIGELRIIEDGSLAPGGLKIETGVGTIDATIETQVEELERALLSLPKKA